jgi:hypothetical protein
MKMIIARGKDEKGRRKRSLFIGKKLSKPSMCNRNSEINEEGSYNYRNLSDWPSLRRLRKPRKTQQKVLTGS